MPSTPEAQACPRPPRLASRKRITLGVCAMTKKTMSKPMTEILQRLPGDTFEIIIFEEKQILEEVIEKWPVVECLIAFHSSGFPLDKAIAYAKLRKPFVVNDLRRQHLLRDRRLVYATLARAGVPTPRHVCVNRDKDIVQRIEEFDDAIVIDGVKIEKPFVEKPVDSDDHNIRIYYPSSAGGGCKRLFRKIGNQSSMYEPELHSIRREGSYLYEEFVDTQGTDVKVYSVGPYYGHAEARKSPTLDGVVMRGADGKELRYPVRDAASVEAASTWRTRCTPSGRHFVKMAWRSILVPRRARYLHQHRSSFPGSKRTWPSRSTTPSARRCAASTFSGRTTARASCAT